MSNAFAHLHFEDLAVTSAFLTPEGFSAMCIDSVFTTATYSHEPLA